MQPMESSQPSGIVRVVVPRRVWDCYDYAVPTNVPIPAVGTRVRVPLGRSRVTGIVVEHLDQSGFKLKELVKVLDDIPLVSEDVVELGRWLSDYYHHPLGSVFETILPPGARSERTAKTRPEQVWALVDSNANPKIRANAHKQREAWDTLVAHGQVRESQLKHLGIQLSALAKFESKGLVTRRDFEPQFTKSKESLVPTQEQQTAIEAISAKLGEAETFLLDGVTGSGKTEVYLQVIATVLRQGQQALVLVPEIAITPQMTRRFEERFGKVAVLHSMVPNARRFDTWAQISTGQLSVVIGTRSAIFVPFANLGVIVVDEEHDSSYKQGDSLRYSARDTAVFRANRLSIPCVLGSATPSLESINNARNGRYRRLRLSHRPGMAELPTFHVQDIRNTPSIGGLSEPSLHRIREHVERDEQVLILINRRGYATQYFCQSCGWVAMCANCDVKLTWHSFPDSFLSCHMCGQRYQAVQECPDCGKADIVKLGVGTQQIEQTLAGKFPDVKLFRIDRDSVSTNRRLETQFRQLQETHDGILIGTQMLAKGHHFPNVTLVVVIAADNGFLATDFRGPERTAQLIVQVAGRAGRASKRGEVWIQSFDPDNPDLNALVETGYDGFVETELKIRKDARLPPFGYMAVVLAEGKDAGNAESFCNEVLAELRKTELTVLGPASAPIQRVESQFRFQGVIIATHRSELHAGLKTVERMRPRSSLVRWSIDVDPADLS